MYNRTTSFVVRSPDDHLSRKKLFDDTNFQTHKDVDNQTILDKNELKKINKCDDLCIEDIVQKTKPLTKKSVERSIDLDDIASPSVVAYDVADPSVTYKDQDKVRARKRIRGRWGQSASYGGRVTCKVPLYFCSSEPWNKLAPIYTDEELKRLARAAVRPLEKRGSFYLFDKDKMIAAYLFPLLTAYLHDGDVVCEPQARRMKSVCQPTTGATPLLDESGDEGSKDDAPQYIPEDLVGDAPEYTPEEDLDHSEVGTSRQGNLSEQKDPAREHEEEQGECS
ncbi:hypothetical protein LWI28_026371 [Acer negundo]|uniref:Uncharacterized protein n=1 Tax=Acer negundo TaxID=4023 RepID=A0AAD5IWL5_ACENE|nr:hypothetical protein LWI28_026371 [Acer negundo]